VQTDRRNLLFNGIFQSLLVSVAVMGSLSATPLGAAEGAPDQHKSYKLVQVAKVPYFVNKTQRRERGYMAVIHNHLAAARDPNELGEGGATAIEVTTGCRLDRETLKVTVFRSHMFGIYGARIDGDIDC
jgi:hypothetical protein